MLSLSRLLAFLFCFLSLAVTSHQALARDAGYRVGAPGAWVAPVQAGAADRPATAASGGRQYLLADMQTRVEDKNMVSYVHLVIRTTDSEGVDDSARVSVSFDPVYQSVTLHTIRLRRAGQVIDKMSTSTIRVLQRETEMETRIFDGRKTVNVEIDDVRVGDVVEYAYSINGSNPVYANQYSGSSYLQWNVPVDRVFVRLMVPEGRPLTVDSSKSGVEPAVTRAGGYADYRWERTNVPALRTEKDGPSGHDPYARMEWSEFADWAAVSKWALPLYRRSAPSPELRKEIDRIAAIGTPALRLREALRVVQRDIRYLGVEEGASSHAPTAASLVFKRRFGDCKDKAMLLLTMLDALSVKAQPVLVNTGRLRKEDVGLPSPNLFNHVIVRAEVDTTMYWIDPTRSEQEGDLAHLFEPNYGQALIIAPDTTELTAMPAVRFALRRVVSTFDSRAGVDKPVGLVVKTVIKGSAADYARSQFASKGAADMQADYLNYYARRHPSIAVAAPIKIVDEKKTNTFTVIESYKIDKFWTDRDDEGKLWASMHSSEVNAVLADPRGVNRVAPLALKFPEEIEEVTVVKLFDVWSVRDSQSTIKDAAFELTHKVSLSTDARTVTVSDHYRAKSDRVEPQRMREYVANIGKATDETGLSLYWNKVAPPAKVDDSHSMARGVLIALLVAAAAAMGWLYTRSTRAHRLLNQQLLIGALAAVFMLAIFVLMVSKASTVVTIIVVVLTVLTIAVKSMAEEAPESHWLHLSRTGRHMKTVRDVLIGSSATLLFFPQALQG